MIEPTPQILQKPFFCNAVRTVQFSARADALVMQLSMYSRIIESDHCELSPVFLAGGHRIGHNEMGCTPTVRQILLGTLAENAPAQLPVARNAATAVHFCLEGRRSIQLSYGRTGCNFLMFESRITPGAPLLRSLHSMTSSDTLSAGLLS